MKLQVLAVFAPTESDSVQLAEKQLEIYRKILKEENDVYEAGSLKDIDCQSDKVGLTLAIEGASCLCTEDEPLQKGLTRLEELVLQKKKPLYVSLTWNTENRFGGGNTTQMGLKEDGKALLELMAEHSIAVDFSHTSDPLAYGILDYIDQKQLKIPVMASHSNFRSVHNVPRNLPDAIAKEIVNRGGIIGLNFIRPFVGGDSLPALCKHLEHGFNLGMKDSMALGADFFYLGDIKLQFNMPYYFEGLENAGGYKNLQELLEKQFGDEWSGKVFSDNFLDFQERI